MPSSRKLRPELLAASICGAFGTRSRLRMNFSIAARPAQSGMEPWTLERLFELFPNLKERRGKRGTALSGGEQQMLAVARALIGNPSVILMDEPTEGLAPALVERMREVLSEIRRAGHAILLIEQNFRFAARIADEIQIMQAGQILARTDDIFEDAITRIAECYLGVGAMHTGDHPRP